jgi:RES domain-containing protein
VPVLWRISNHETLSGEGGLRYAARWHSAGRPIVYLAESPAGAMIEVLVHLELEEDELPRSYSLLQVEVPEDVGIETIRVPAGEGWKADLAVSRGLGDAWLGEGRSAVARVPSAILPETANYLLNPAHAEAGRLRVVSVARPRFDARLLRNLRG